MVGLRVHLFLDPRYLFPPPRGCLTMKFLAVDSLCGRFREGAERSWIAQKSCEKWPKIVCEAASGREVGAVRIGRHVIRGYAASLFGRSNSRPQGFSPSAYARGEPANQRTSGADGPHPISTFHVVFNTPIRTGGDPRLKVLSATVWYTCLGGGSMQLGCGIG